MLLAEGLLKKHIASHSLHEPEGAPLPSCLLDAQEFFCLIITCTISALSVYISLLEQQSKYSDALEVISGTLGSLIMIEVDRLRIQVFSCMIANKYY